MRRIMTISLFVLVVLAALELQAPGLGASPQSAGGCACPKGKVCCYNCDGSFAYCARSHAFCPECPAP